MPHFRLGTEVGFWRLVETPRSWQNAHVARVTVRGLTRWSRVGDDGGAGQLHVGFVISDSRDSSTPGR